jgi:hypothetical protein
MNPQNHLNGEVSAGTAGTGAGNKAAQVISISLS